MKNRSFIFFILTLITFQLKAQEWEADNTMIGKKQPGGFDYQWKKFTKEEVGERNYPFNYNGVVEIKHAPAAGVHPRIYFNEEDIPDIAYRLSNTNNGKELMQKVKAFNILLLTGVKKYDPNAPYAKNSAGLKYINNPGSYDVNEFYMRLIKADTTGYAKLLNRMNRFGSAICMEAFECLLNKNATDAATQVNYNQRAKNLATAMSTVAKTGLALGATPEHYQPLVGVALAIAYDLNYWVMNDEQKEIVRKAIASIVPDKPRYGSDVTPYATTGNWTTLDCFEPIANMAIEGELGYKPKLTHLWMQSMYKFINYGWYDSGCPWEGMGKNYMMVGQQIAFAKRGYSLLGHPHMRSFGNTYLPNIIQPFGFAFMSEDTWGGFGSDTRLGKYRFHVIDAVGLKYAYPKDEAVDFVWRNYSNNLIDGKESLDYADNFVPGSHGYFDIMTILMAYVSDSKDGSWEEQNKTALNNKLDFFETERGLSILRSDFSQNAMTSLFYVRQNFGGHTYADRNDFALSANGRIWITKRFGGFGLDASDAQSVILVDGKAMAITNKEGDKCRVPAKLEKWSSTSNLSQATGNATYAYSWTYTWDALLKNQPAKNLGKNGWEKETKTLNDFRAISSKEFFYNIPFYDFASWIAPDGYTEHMLKRPFNPMQKVFRTIGMVKGKHPFLILIDDIKKDDSLHQYDWVAQLPDDIELEKIEKNSKPNEQLYDVILKEKNGNRKLLVRVLNQTDFIFKNSSPNVKVENHEFIAGNGKKSTIYRLVISSNSVAPNFKMLILPFNNIGEIPKTILNKNKTELEVNWSDENKKIKFVSELNGSTSLKDLSF